MDTHKEQDGKLSTFQLSKEELLMSLGVVRLVGSFVSICSFYIF